METHRRPLRRTCVSGTLSPEPPPAHTHNPFLLVSPFYFSHFRLTADRKFPRPSNAMPNFNNKNKSAEKQSSGNHLGNTLSRKRTTMAQNRISDQTWAQVFPKDKKSLVAAACSLLSIFGPANHQIINLQLIQLHPMLSMNSECLEYTPHVAFTPPASLMPISRF